MKWAQYNFHYSPYYHQLNKNTCIFLYLWPYLLTNPYKTLLFASMLKNFSGHKIIAGRFAMTIYRPIVFIYY